MQSIKVHELAPPTCVLLLSKNLIHLFSSMLLPLCPCPCPTSTSLSQSLSKLSYLCTISLPLSSISIKGVLLINAKVYIWGRWLRLESSIFYGHHLIVAFDMCLLALHKFLNSICMLVWCMLVVELE